MPGGLWPLALLLLSVGYLIGCLEESGKSTEIIIPPGDQVRFVSDEFLYYSDNNYKAFLRRPGASNGKLETVLDITPDQETIMQRGAVHGTIIPKGLTLTGTLILQVDMEFHETKLYAFIFDNQPVTPSLETTLVYNVLTKYPDKDIGSYSRQDIENLVAYVKSMAAERMEAFGLVREMNPNALYKFLKNGLANNPEFLDLLASAGARFHYNSDGDILAPPYPFGAPNNSPALDLINSTPPGNLTAKEDTLIEISAEAMDPDGDLLFYTWRREGAIILQGLQSYSWQPSFKEGRLEPYPIQLLISDGGKIITITWDVSVQDFNRKPRIKKFCLPSAFENQKWTCQLSSEDPDEDNVKWILSANGFSTPPTLNGVPAPTEFSGSDILLEWTPDNEDARVQSRTLEIRLDDGKLGLDVRSMTLTVSENNQAPYIFGGGIQPTNPNHTSAREWDTCLQSDPDGLGDFAFDLVIRDPDNDAGATPPDVINVSIAGTLGSDIALVGKNATPTQTVFQYRWRPAHTRKTGSLLIQISDDHGATTPLITLPISAEDRNQRACLSGTPSGGPALDDVDLFRDLTATASDPEADVPFILAYNIPATLAPFLSTCTTHPEPLVLRQSFYDSEMGYRTANTSFNQCLRANLHSNLSGLGRLARTIAYSQDITIPAGFKVKTRYPSFGKRLEFEVANSIVIGPFDRYVTLPLLASSRTAQAGEVNQIPGGIAADPTITVTNPLAISGETGLVTFQRPSPGANVTLPAGLSVTTNDTLPGSQTIVFEVLEDSVFPAAATSLSVAVSRKRLTVPEGTVLDFASPLPDTNLSLTAHSKLTDASDYVIYSYKGTGTTLGVDRFCWQYKAFEGARANVNEISGLGGTLSDPSVQVRNPLSFVELGAVEFFRPAPSGVVAIPMGFVVKTPNGKGYQTLSAASLNAGETLTTVPVRRLMEASPTTGTTCIGMKDRNYPAQFTSLPSASVDEGKNLIAHPIVVSDNPSAPLSPKDPNDRYIFTSRTVGLSPEGAYLLCRNPGTDPANIAVPACQPCNTSAGLTHEQSRKCYLRFSPSPLDVANTFQFEITTDDQGATFPNNSNKRYLNINVSVLEVNDPPFLTDRSWNPISSPMGLDQNTPIDIGTFLEGSTGTAYLYAQDNDKSLDFKKVNFAILPQVFDIKSGTWVNGPSGLTIGIDQFSSLPGGFGATTRALLKWNPSDEDAKRFSSSEGFVLKVNVYDAPSNASARKTVVAYYKIRVLNRNTPPLFGTIGANNIFTIPADTYFSTTFTLSDTDAYTPLEGSFSTELASCREVDGSPNLHPTLDPWDPSPVDCHFTDSDWGEEITQYDPTYVDNRFAGAPNCRLGGDESGLNDDLAVPKLTRIGGPQYVGQKVQYTYKLEWCPQKGHIGRHVGSIRAKDNGDVARSGAISTALGGSAALQLEVVTPVFLVSPRLDGGGNPEHHMVQTAAGLGTSKRWQYPIIVNNSKKNPLSFNLVSAPRPCEEANGVCLITGANNTAILNWEPRYPDDITDPLDPLTWHRFEVRVVDSVTLEEDRAHFFLQVQNPLSPIEASPTIDSALPSAAIVHLRELETQVFSVNAVDSNSNDRLHYRWYVNNVLISDEGPSFSYKPGAQDGSLDTDGPSGPLGLGQHILRAEVSDGNSVASRSWQIHVRNTILVPEAIFSLSEARLQTSPPATVSEIQWLQETFLGTSVSGSNLDYLFFTGSYKRGAQLKNYIWSLQFLNGVLPIPNGNLLRPPWNFYEDLPWASGLKSERISVKEASGVVDVMVTPQWPRAGPFTATTNSIKVRGDLTAESIPISSSKRCIGTCAKYFYVGDNGYGSRPTAPYLTHLFWADDSGSQLMWDNNGGSPQLVADFGNDIISSVAVNKTLKRLYVTTQNLALNDHNIQVFNIAPVESGGPPTFIAKIPVFDGVAGHESSIPMDLVVVEDQNKVFGFLAGVGGLLVLNDDGSGTPNVGDTQYVGVGTIAASPTDLISSGIKLAYHEQANLLVGISRLGHQVYTVDLATYAIYSYSTDRPFHSVLVMSKSNLVLLIDRTNAKVFIVK